ncbi:MAG: hypothetical protein IJM77_04975 [Spirochaetia bacterium]|nr:hypothetical protein [Spirochaetia bacterium]
MKRIAVFLLIFIFSFSSQCAYGATFNGPSAAEAVGALKSGSWTAANVGKPVKPDPVNKDISDLKVLYIEFQKFWHVKDKDDLQDRFEEFLKSKNIYTKEIDDYDEFIEVWVENYDADLDYDDLYDLFELDLLLEDSDDPDEYDILLNDDIDDLYDDYLDDYIDEEYYEDYGEYFDEVYYD